MWSRLVGPKFMAAALGALILVAALACTREVEVPGETVTVEKVVVEEVEVPGETVVVEKVVVEEVEVPGETVVVEKEVVVEVEIPGETMVVEKEVVVEVEVPGETMVVEVEKEVIREVEVPGETVVVEKEVVVEVERVVEVEVERTMMASDIQRGGTLILGTPQVVQFLDPQRGGLANNRNATHGLFNSLTFWGDDGAPTNDLATAWEVSSDGVTWNFDLERNVKFHNGRQMTAADVKFSFDRILDPEFTAARFFARSLAAVDRVSVVDESTVRFELSEPSGTLLSSMINTRIVAKENVDVIDNSAIGTGPFKLAEYVVNDKVVLNAFPDYFLDGEDGGALPYLDGVIVRTIPDTTALFTALETGIVDVYWQLAPKFAVQLDGSTNALAVPSSFQTNYSIFLFEIDRGVFQDRDARLALLHAIDKDAIVTVGFEGLAEPGYTNNILGPGSLFLKSDLKEYRQDPEMARQLFQDLGITKLKFVAPAVNPEWKPISIVLERNLNDVGVELDIELLSVEAWFASIGNLGETDWFDTNMFSTNIRFLPPEPDIPITSWTCGNHFASGWCDEEMDMWTVRGRQAVDPAERREAYFKVQELWNEKVPAIPFGYRSIHHGQTNRVRDLKNLFADLYYTGTWLVR